MLQVQFLDPLQWFGGSWVGVVNKITGNKSTSAPEAITEPEPELEQENSVIEEPIEEPVEQPVIVQLYW